MKHFKNLNFLILLLFVFSVSASCTHGKRHKKDGSHKSMWKKMDVNKDHQVSHDEFMKAHEKKFKKMDADGDGKVSKSREEGMEEKEA